MNVLMASFLKRFATQHRELSETRRELEAWMRTADSPDCPRQSVIDDVAVVATELVANVIDHTDSPWVRLMVRCDPGHVRVDVSHQGSAIGLADPERWGMQIAADRGRGLRIVKALCSSIDVERDGRTTTIRCEVPAT